MTTLVDLDAVTVAGYRLRTGDRDTEASAVTGALVEAQSLLEEELRRLLPLIERDEQMRIRADGRVYPKAWPIVSAELVIDGRSLVGATPDLESFVALIGSREEPRMTVTYTGGFDDGTNGTALPVTLRDAIYDLAFGVVFSRPPVLVGAGSASVGDVSVSITSPGDEGVDAYVPGLSRRVAKYRNRFL